MFRLSRKMSLFPQSFEDETVYAYAVSELERLLKLSGSSVQRKGSSGQTRKFQLTLVNEGSKPNDENPNLSGIKWDGYRLTVGKNRIVITARESRGILYGVYELAERLGFVFLKPGEEG
ncbi:MAG TPA: glycoside hydrolase family 20 zincin-like fold domain-containing protein, partial [bacterium]|nr:glycoside hydrolase family 20 zincin-like fold domain-containing protein [bacterium]